ncbi:inositol monophosphatase family protein [Altererythrobacter sp. MTPC7]|uniref:inositol monophosphatase family protein n=1 Tax=Altererythrobacter sp. MTPC7 TaxID=3056567 RepID=UPI0036F3BAB4
MRRVTEQAILPRYRNLSDSQIVEKAADDLVTIADREAEIMLAEGLAAIDAGPAIVGEEAVHGDPSIMDALSGDCWIIDPIDGTHNFAHGQPPFGIIIARSEGGLCRSGWILDCLTGRFCHAHSCTGAFVDGERIHARPAGREKPVAAMSMMFLTPEQQEFARLKVAPHYEMVEIPRCAAEQYPRLALGQNDVSSFRRLLPWDHAAGVLFLNEAGGKAARGDGSAYRVDDIDKAGRKAGLVGASSPEMWDAFVAVLREGTR